MPVERTKLTRDELFDGKMPPNNHVLVELLFSNEHAKTKSGIEIGFGYGVTYAEGNNSIGADLQEVFGVVRRVPDKLYYVGEDGWGMGWETDIDIHEGDYVWYSLLESANAVEIECDNIIYKLIPYEDLYVARRGGIKGDVVCLNGYVLLSTVNKVKISELDYINPVTVDMNKGIVRYVGKPNKRYVNERFADHGGLMPGDTVLFAPRTPIFFLERKSYMANFDGDNLYMVVQARRIMMILKREENGKN